LDALDGLQKRDKGSTFQFRAFFAMSEMLWRWVTTPMALQISAMSEVSNA
jgi:hypothetical protein